MAAAAAVWRQPAFIRLVGETVSDPQLSRFKKIYHEPFFVLSVRGASGASAATFKISGSTRTAYVVDIAANGTTRCSCMDAVMHCRNNDCVCKHVCFVLYRVLRLVRVDFFDDLVLAPEEVGAIAGSVAMRRAAGGEEFREPTAPAMRPDQVDAMCHGDGRKRPRPQEAGTSAAHDFTAVRRPPEPNDECPVCYDALYARDDLRGCPSCGNGVHRACVVRWLENSPRATCVYCRSPAWGAYNKK
jgi:hypothetical protein